jgi:hypothetical protein
MPLDDVVDLFHAFLKAGIARLAENWPSPFPQAADRQAPVLPPVPAGR